MAMKRKNNEDYASGSWKGKNLVLCRLMNPMLWENSFITFVVGCFEIEKAAYIIGAAGSYKA